MKSSPKIFRAFAQTPGKSILCSYPTGSTVTQAGTPRVGGEREIREFYWSRAGEISQQYGKQEEALQPHQGEDSAGHGGLRQTCARTQRLPSLVTTTHSGQHIPLS